MENWWKDTALFLTKHDDNFVSAPFRFLPAEQLRRTDKAVGYLIPKWVNFSIFVPGHKVSLFYLPYMVYCVCHSYNR